MSRLSQHNTPKPPKKKTTARSHGEARESLSPPFITIPMSWQSVTWWLSWPAERQCLKTVRFPGDFSDSRETFFKLLDSSSNGTFISPFSHALTGRETSRVTCIHYGNVIFQLALTHAQWGRQGVNFMRQWFWGRGCFFLRVMSGNSCLFFAPLLKNKLWRVFAWFFLSVF